MSYLPRGTLIGGRYRTEEVEPIKSGGMQYVYRATDTLLERPVALKTPKPDNDKRFERSARFSARINHANATRTLDYVEEGGSLYLIEEWVEGQDLGKILKRVKRFDPYMSAYVLHALARALCVMHEVEVVHRDLKPSNIMAVGGLELTGIKVTDFGVANLAEGEIDRGVAGGMLTITGSRTLIGALPYLAPEILRRRKTVTKSADIWAVGALTFHMMTGQTPFGDELEAVAEILKGNVPPLPAAKEAQPQYDGLYQEIYGIVRACLQADQDKRPDARELLRLCGRLCYPIAEREIGTVTQYHGNYLGFASAHSDDKGGVFFHLDSVLGSRRPSIGGEIWFSRHPGSPKDRAHPVVTLLPEEE
ncbi:MAG TPA: serine/threonine-protein kinase [Polyangium sp.]|nr:serine/threonine-protein kinase [Polyangium sp.]